MVSREFWLRRKEVTSFLPERLRVTADAPYWLSSRPLSDSTTVASGSTAVVITNYNLGTFLGYALDSLSSSTRLPDHVVVVDDGSTEPGELALLEEVTTWARQAGLTVDLLLCPANRGLSAARNAELAATDPDYIIS